MRALGILESKYWTGKSMPNGIRGSRGHRSRKRRLGPSGKNALVHGNKRRMPRIKELTQDSARRPGVRPGPGSPSPKAESPPPRHLNPRIARIPPQSGLRAGAAELLFSINGSARLGLRRASKLRSRDSNRQTAS